MYSYFFLRQYNQYCYFFLGQYIQYCYFFLGQYIQYYYFFLGQYIQYCYFFLGQYILLSPSLERVLVFHHLTPQYLKYFIFLCKFQGCKHLQLVFVGLNLVVCENDGSLSCNFPSQMFIDLYIINKSIVFLYFYPRILNSDVRIMSLIESIIQVSNLSPIGSICLKVSLENYIFEIICIKGLSTIS